MASIKQQLLLQKIHTTDADPVPVGANALLVEGLDIAPLEMAMNEVDYALGGFSKEMGTPGEFNARVRFNVDFGPSGTADVPPGFGPSLRACGFQELITPATSVGYALVSEGFEAVAYYGWVGNTLHKVIGARGTVTLDVPAGKPPKLQFDMLGRFVDPGDVALATPAYSGLMAPKSVSKANTTFRVNAGADRNLVLNAFNLQLGNSVVFRDRPHYEAIDIDDRNPSGSFSYHQEQLSQFNAFSIAKNATPFLIELTHTVAVGHAAKATIAVAQAGRPTYGADGNLRLVTLPFNGRRNPSGSDVAFLFT